MALRQPRLQLQKHLAALPDSQTKQHECNELIRKATNGRLEPHRVFIKNLFKTNLELITSLDSEFGAGSGQQMCHVFTGQPLTVQQLDPNFFVEQEIQELEKEKEDVLERLNEAKTLVKDAISHEDFLAANKHKLTEVREVENLDVVDHKISRLRAQQRMVTEAKEKGQKMGEGAGPTFGAQHGACSEEMVKAMVSGLNNLNEFLLEMGKEWKGLRMQMGTSTESMVKALGHGALLGALEPGLRGDGKLDAIPTPQGGKPRADNESEKRRAPATSVPAQAAAVAVEALDIAPDEPCKDGKSKEPGASLKTSDDNDGEDENMSLSENGVEKEDEAIETQTQA